MTAALLHIGRKFGAAALLPVALSVGAAAPAGDAASAASADALQQAVVSVVAGELAPFGLRLDAERVQVKMERPFTSRTLLRVEPRWQMAHGRPVLPLAVALRGADGEVVQATLSTTLWRDVLVARQALRRGQPIDCAALEPSSRDIESVPTSVLRAGCKPLEGLVARRDVGAGAVLLATDVGPTPDVAAHREVRLRAAIGAIAIERDGVALADAARGQAVLVRIAGTTRAVRGIVVDRNLVELKEDRP
jgi:flagella basal body P-ring formation protein FlgA